jgi:hypothetical protein
MAHGHVHEEAEHASHHSGDPFDRQVAMTMVVIAALLAGVKVQAHRTHNDTLAYKTTAGVKLGEANAYVTSSSNAWNFFQAKKMREALARNAADLLRQQVQPGMPMSDDKLPPGLPDKAARSTALVKELKDENVEDAEKVAADILERAEKSHRGMLKQGYTAEQAVRIIDHEVAAARYRAEGGPIRQRAIKEGKSAEEKKEEGNKAQDKSKKLHDQANWFDAGELGVELAIVLCSVAILAKQKSFWYLGMLVAAIGAVIVGIGFFK